MSAPAVGIDLGTTYSCVAVYRNGQAEVIANSLGNRITPSVVAFGSERLVGDAAKEKEALNPENTIFDVKRLIGRHFDDPNVQRDMKTWPFEVVNEDGKPKIKVTHMGERRTFFPEQISAMVLTSMKTTAEKYIGKPVKQAVITVPAHFTDSQRQATKDAATIAGLKVQRIINEPTAAALAYGYHNNSEDERNILVFDLGGGTFDVSILSIEEGVFEVQATAGDTHLGGTDFDAKLVEYFAAEFQRRHGINLRGDNYALRRLRTASERAKRTLSVAREASIELDALHAGRDFRAMVTRARFEQLCSELFKSTLEPVKLALRDANKKVTDIDEVVLVGGSTRIPAIQALIRGLFNGKEPVQTVNPDEAVAVGAAIESAILDDNPSQAITNLVLLDVTPLSLGIQVVGGISSFIISRNTAIPVRKTGQYTTNSDYQTAVDFIVFEGERAMVADNHKLGNFLLTGIHKARRGEPDIQVTFEIDADGILHASAVEKISKKHNSITIVNNKGRLSKEQIEKLIHEAEVFKKEDARKKSTADTRNALERKCYDMREELDDQSIPNRNKVLNKINEILSWLAENPPATQAEYNQKIRELDVLY